MSDNFDAFEEGDAGDDNILAHQAVPSLKKEKITFLSIKNYFLSAVSKISFNVNAGVSVARGEMAYNLTEDTFDLGYLNDVVGQTNQEFHYPVTNNSGALITNGTLCMADGGTSPTDNMTVVPFDGDRNNARFILGIATHDIGIAGFGKLTKNGKVRGVDTSIYSAPVLWADPTGDGKMVSTEPANAAIGMPVAFVLITDAVDGVLYVRVTSFDEHVAKVNPVSLETYSALPARNSLESIHGGFVSILQTQDPNAAPVVMTGANAQGIGKLVIVVNSATPDCTLTVSGTVVDRDTGVESPGSSELIVDTATTDTTATDTNGIPKIEIANGYITDEWFTGDVTITGVGTTVPTDIDIYHCSFEQYNDAEVIQITTADLNVLCTNSGGAAISAYLYTVVVVDGKVVITSIAEYVNALFVTDRFYRIRRGALDVILDGRKDGVFVNIAFLGSPSKFADAGTKVWANVVL